MNKFKTLGITDERDTCECCGKKGLKRVVALQRLDDSEIVYYGSNCAAMALFGRKGQTLAKKVECLAEKAQQEQERKRIAKTARVVTYSQTRASQDAELNWAMNEANRRYNRTGRPIESSYFATRSSEIVRVDGNDNDDVEFYKSIGFVQSTLTVKELKTTSKELS